MANKTVPSTGGIDDFIGAIADEGRRAEAAALRTVMERASGHPAVLWGSMIGFGDHHYKYDSGREGDTFVVGFAPRAAAITLYGLRTAYESSADWAQRLGKHTSGKGCLYVKHLDDIHLDALEELVRSSLER